MDSSFSSQTSPTLLGRLRQEPADQDAWGLFVERYGRLIYGWVRKWQLQGADAEGVTQMVLVRLAQRMRGLAYDPPKRFRGWVRALTRPASSGFVGAAAARRRGP